MLLHAVWLQNADELFESGKQADSTAHAYPEKLGEVVAGLHSLMVQNFLRMLLQKRNTDKFKNHISHIYMRHVFSVG